MKCLAEHHPLGVPPTSLLEAIQHGEVLWDGDNKTVKIDLPDGRPAVVRYGKHVRISEALTVQHVQKHSSAIPVAPVISVYSSKNMEDSSTINYIISEWIEGSVLEDVWSQLSTAEKGTVVSQLRGIVSAIRQVPFDSPAETYIGSVGRNPCGDPLLGDLGPYANINEFNEALLELAKPYFRHSYIHIIRRLLTRNLDYRIVFTHGDIAPRNIIVRQNPEHGWEVAAILDWECAGFYPEHWEYVKCLNAVKWSSDWAEQAQFLLERHYDEEFLFDTRLRFFYRM
jgi:Phosphotransferase enzyme family